MRAWNTAFIGEKAQPDLGRFQWALMKDDCRDLIAEFIGQFRVMRGLCGPEFLELIRQMPPVGIKIISGFLFASIVSIAIENAMAVKSMEASHELNEAYRFRLENMNKQLLESSKELEYLSLYDSVTSLPNRSLFHDRLARDIGERISNRLQLRQKVNVGG